MTMRIAFLGTPAFAVPALVLEPAGHSQAPHRRQVIERSDDELPVPDSGHAVTPLHPTRVADAPTLRA
jgi:hypothetical protein